MKVYLQNTIFHFKAILDLLNKLKIRPDNYLSGTLFQLVDPLNENLNRYKLESHLTDQQTVADQIRFLGILEIERKLRRLAKVICDTKINEHIEFVIIDDWTPNEEFLIFIQYLRKFKQTVIVRFESELEKITKVECVPCYSKVERILSKGEYMTHENMIFLLKTSFYIINNGDYFSAINILNIVNKIPIKNNEVSCEIECRLAACNEFLGNTFVAEKYWVKALEYGNFNQRYRASYSLALLYLRHHDLKYQDVIKGKKYLNDMYEELKIMDQEEPSTLNTINMVFNRNGFALALFKEGEVEKAEMIVKKGIKRLDCIDSQLSFFHKTVLLYNLAQCYKKNKEFKKVENILKILIEMDSKFYVYHEYLIQFYLDENEYLKVIHSCEEAIKIDSGHFRYYQFLGINYYKNEHFEASKVAFEKATLLNPMDFNSIAHLSTLYIETSEYLKNKNMLGSVDFTMLSENQFQTLTINYLISLINLNVENKDIVENIDYFMKIGMGETLLTEFKKVYLA